MALDARGHNTPPLTGVAPNSNVFDALSYSIRDIVYVANKTERTQKVTALTAAGYPPSATNPLYVHRGDAAAGCELERTTDGGTTWATIPADAGALPVTLTSGWAVSGAAMTVRVIGQTILLDPVQLQRTSGLAVSPGTFYNVGSIPAAARPAATISIPGAVGVNGNLGACQAQIDAGGAVVFTPYLAPGTINAGGGVSNSVVLGGASWSRII